MDPLQSSSLEGHPRVESPGSTSAVGAEGYATVKTLYFRDGPFYRTVNSPCMVDKVHAVLCVWCMRGAYHVGVGCERRLRSVPLVTLELREELHCVC